MVSKAESEVICVHDVCHDIERHVNCVSANKENEWI